jgi:hypothetical protein
MNRQEARDTSRYKMDIQVAVGHNLPEQLKKQIAGRSKEVEEANKVKAKYKIEIHFGPDRSTSDLKPCAGGLCIWESGKMYHGGGDEKMYWCGYDDCKWPFSADLFAIAHVVCPRCNREQFRSHKNKVDHIRYLEKERMDSRGIENIPVMVGEKLFKLPPTKIATLLVATFRQLDSNADIYLKYHPKDIRIDKKNPSSAESMNKLVVARLRKKPLIYPLKNILKDTASGADLHRQFLTMLKA